MRRLVYSYRRHGLSRGRLILAFIGGIEVPLEVALLGLVAGLTYGLLGIGLSLVYKTSRVLNFAHGEMGALPALALTILVLNNGWSYWLALPLALAIAVGIGGVVELLVIRRLRNASRLVVLVATIGVAQLLSFISLLLPQGNIIGQSFPTPFTISMEIGGLRLGTAHLLTLVIVPAAVIALTLFFQRGRLGRASRAAAENEEAARVAGIPVHRVAQTMWILAALLAVISAVLIGPTQPITAQQALGPALMVRALGAAMIGGLVSLPGTFAGGLLIGVIESVTVWNYPVGGALEVVLLGVIVVSLLARKGLGQVVRGGDDTSWNITGRLPRLDPRTAAHPKVRRARRFGIVGLLAAAALVPLALSTPLQFFMTTVVLFALMGLSLVVLTGYAGQISLGQFAFVAVGAAVGGRLLLLGYPYLSALALAALISGLVALAVGIPAVRIRGLFLAVTTLAFAVAVASWLFKQQWLVQSADGESALSIPRPEWLGISFEGEVPYYWLSLAMLVLVSLVVHRLRRTGMGRSLIAVRDNELAASSLSVSPRRLKLQAFALSGMIAGLAGFLYGGLLVNFGYNPASLFGPARSLALVTIVIFGGVTTITGSILGSFWVQGMPQFFGEEIGMLSSGMGILLILLIVPGGLVAVAFTVRDRIAGWLVGGSLGASGQSESSTEADAAAGSRTEPVRAGLLATTDGAAQRDGQTVRPTQAVRPTDGGAPLEAHDVVVRYGGHPALDGASVHAAPGEVVGLMGPNGAGKTTLFDVLSGQVQPDAGKVLLRGADIGHLPPFGRARLGIGRTFQQARLFDGLTVTESLQVAMECPEPTATVSSLLGLPNSRLSEARKRDRADEILDLLGLGAFAHRPVADLSTGLRRMTELGCVVAMGSEVLLLDEPTAGFARDEVERFEPLLGQIREFLGATVIVIDHDVSLMTRLVDRLYVLVAGRIIAEGLPSILHEDRAVVASYFGTGEDDAGGEPESVPAGVAGERRG